MYKTEKPGIMKVRDGVLINTDNDALAAYKKRKMRERKIESVQEELAELKGEMSEIKSMLKEILAR